MKALDEYFLMVVFPLLLNRVRVFAIFTVNLNRESKRVKEEIFLLLPDVAAAPLPIPINVTYFSIVQFHYNGNLINLSIMMAQPFLNPLTPSPPLPSIFCRVVFVTFT